MKWEAVVRYFDNSSKSALTVFAEVSPGSYRVLVPMMHDGKIGWGIVDVTEGETLPTTMEFSRSLARGGVFDAIVTALAESGAKVREDPTTATVEAMKDHLSDLKSIIFGSDTLKLERRSASDATV